MRLRFSIVADSAIQAVDGKVSVIGIHSGILAPELPVTHVKSTIVICFALDHEDVDTEHTLLTELADPEGKIIMRIEGKIKLDRSLTDFEDKTIILNGLAFRLEKYGLHEIRFSLDGDLVDVARLHVHKPKE